MPEGNDKNMSQPASILKQINAESFTLVAQKFMKGFSAQKRTDFGIFSLEKLCVIHLGYPGLYKRYNGFLLKAGFLIGWNRLT